MNDEIKGIMKLINTNCSNRTTCFGCVFELLENRDKIIAFELLENRDKIINREKPKCLKDRLEKELLNKDTVDEYLAHYGKM